MNREIKDFAEIVDKTIPTDLDSDYEAYENLHTLFDEEIKLTTMKDVYIDDRVRVKVLSNKKANYVDDKGAHDGYYIVQQFAYMKDNGWGASEFDGSLEELNTMGLNNLIYEAVIGEEGLFDTRGSSVCTGDMPN